MRTILFPLALAINVVAMPAAASEPGQPLDCSDWVFLEPGLSCSEVVPYPCPLLGGGSTAISSTLCTASNDHRAIDTQGFRLWVRSEGRPESCGSGPLRRLELVRLNGATIEILGYLDDRCVEPIGSGTKDTVNADGPEDTQMDYQPSAAIAFDPINGSLLVTVGLACFGSCDYVPAKALWRIEGFTTTFEILQSYEPAANAWGFRVPYMPEGLPAADHFDTYSGPLVSPFTFAGAQSLACGYPATAPAISDYVTVPDTTSTLELNTGRWYLTAVNSGSQTRFGRQRIAGVLSGRPANLLGPCEEMR